MAEVKSLSNVMNDRAAFHLVRRAQSTIAIYQNFDGGDLAQYLERASFETMAARLTKHFFPNVTEQAVNKLVIDLYTSQLIMAPILQRLPLSAKFDWHRGHLLSFLRMNTCRRRGRFHVAVREVPRMYQPDVLAHVLSLVGIRDSLMVEVLLDLHRRHAGGITLKDHLAYQIFDPLLLSTKKEGFELRHGNHLIRLEKEAFLGSRDLRQEALELLDFQIRSVQHKEGAFLEIRVSQRCLNLFREQIKTLLNTPAEPVFKIRKIEDCIRNLVEQTRHARSAFEQLQELRQWLANKLQPLAGTHSEVKLLPQLLVNKWLQRSDFSLFVKSPNFFFDPTQHNEKTFTTFFSPYREK